jgi:hypothetical protein
VKPLVSKEGESVEALVRLRSARKVEEPPSMSSMKQPRPSLTWGFQDTFILFDLSDRVQLQGPKIVQLPHFLSKKKL